MFTRTRNAPTADQPDVQQLHGDAVAAVARAESEVSRLSALVKASGVAVSDAEARAADAIEAPDSNATSDTDVMNAVAAARARRDATVLAQARATAALAESKAALPALERKIRRVAAENDLAELQPLLAQVDQAIELLATACPVLEQQYNSGMNALVETADKSQLARFDQLSAPALHVGSRIRSLLARRLGKDIFPAQSSGIWVAEATVSESVETIVSSMKTRVSELDRQR